ncbi:MAG: germination protein YpeB [Clostridia bacterium]|nr:germination protein YpeB [Clostridia bacterium]
MKKQINYKKANFWLAVALIVVSMALIVVGVLFISNISKVSTMASTIENVYQRNFYDLVDNVNNAEVKLSKVLASDYDSYTKKMLGEISKNASSASYNLSNLPISLNGLDETKKFINQVSGYVDSLADKLDKGQNLTEAEKDELLEIYNSMLVLKQNLGKFNDDIMKDGYNIFKNGNLLGADYNGFTKSIQGIKVSDVEYPTMIYDGPFADGQYDKKVKGLNGELVDVAFAKDKIKQIYKTVTEKDIKYITETKGKFQTFDFSVNLYDNITAYIQITKTGGHLLTVSGYGDDNNKNITLSDAMGMVRELIKSETNMEFDCVWSDVVGSDAYLNFAPVLKGVVMYPDLIKAKVDLASGIMTGYSASSYYTNHTPRQLVTATFSKENADKKVPAGYDVLMSRLCIAPLDYGQEKLCYEYKCTQNDSTYYIYINANTGITENILKVIETSDGNKLM